MPEEEAQIHRIRITLTSRNVKSLEKGQCKLFLVVYGGGPLVFSGILVNIFENLLGRGLMKILLRVKILVITLFFNCGPFYYKMCIVCILIFGENPMMFKTDAAFHI